MTTWADVIALLRNYHADLIEFAIRLAEWLTTTSATVTFNFQGSAAVTIDSLATISSRLLGGRSYLKGTGVLAQNVVRINKILTLEWANLLVASSWGSFVNADDGAGGINIGKSDLAYIGSSSGNNYYAYACASTGNRIYVNIIKVVEATGVATVEDTAWLGGAYKSAIASPVNIKIVVSSVAYAVIGYTFIVCFTDTDATNNLVSVGCSYALGGALDASGTPLTLYTVAAGYEVKQIYGHYDSVANRAYVTYSLQNGTNGKIQVHRIAPGATGLLTQSSTGASTDLFGIITNYNSFTCDLAVGGAYIHTIFNQDVAGTFVAYYGYILLATMTPIAAEVIMYYETVNSFKVRYIKCMDATRAYIVLDDNTNTDSLYLILASFVNLALGKEMADEVTRMLIMRRNNYHCDYGKFNYLIDITDKKLFMTTEITGTPGAYLYEYQIMDDKVVLMSSLEAGSHDPYVAALLQSCSFSYYNKRIVFGTCTGVHPRHCDERMDFSGVATTIAGSACYVGVTGCEVAYTGALPGYKYYLQENLAISTTWSPFYVGKGVSAGIIKLD